MTALHTCPDCGVQPGEFHWENCDQRQCPRCGGQKLGCHCLYEINGVDPMTFKGPPTSRMRARWKYVWGRREIPWSGEPTGVPMARAMGLFMDDEEGMEDVCRMFELTRWDPDTQQFIPLSETTEGPTP